MRLGGGRVLLLGGAASGGGGDRAIGQPVAAQRGHAGVARPERAEWRGGPERSGRPREGVR